MHRQLWLVSVAHGLIQEARDSFDADSEISDFAPTDENSCDADSENSDFEPADENLSDAESENSSQFCYE